MCIDYLTIYCVCKSTLPLSPKLPLLADIPRRNENASFITQKKKVCVVLCKPNTLCTVGNIMSLAKMVRDGRTWAHRVPESLYKT